MRVKPKEAARHSHGILISSGAHVVSQFVRLAYVVYTFIITGAASRLHESAGIVLVPLDELQYSRKLIIVAVLVAATETCS